MNRPYLHNIDLNKRILEIGPLCTPMISKNASNNVFYTDIRPTEGIRDFYKNEPSVDSAGICEIDYVIKNSYLETFSDVEKFDYVLASHVIEHMSELILSFQDIATIMKPNGLLCLTIPDKRYCLDHFRMPTSFAEVYDVYKQGIKNHPMRVFDFFINAVPTLNDPVFFWSEQEDVTAKPHMYPYNTAQNAYETARKGEYLDVHFSVFTTDSFLLLLYNMTRASLLPFRCVEFYTTQRNSFEFSVVLQLEPSLLLENSSIKSTELDKVIALMERERERERERENFHSFNIHDFYEKRIPSEQNIADLFKRKWVSHLPRESINVLPGTFLGFGDDRIHWLAERFNFRGKKVLELGPMEAAHSYMMEKLYGASEITAIEANTNSFLKCLCVKEIFHLQHCNFLLGDFCKYLDVCENHYDLVLASGVLYHMKDPFALLKAASKVTNALYLWTHYYDDGLCKKEDVSQYFSHEIEHHAENGTQYPYVKYFYKNSVESELFLGGLENYSNWLMRDSIIRYLQLLGFNKIDIGFENLESKPGPSFVVFARKD